MPEPYNVNKRNVWDMGDSFVLNALTLMNQPDKEAIFAATDRVIELRINGIELPFAATMEKFQEAYKKQVDERAGELLKEKLEESMGRIFDDLDDFRRATQEKFQQLARQYGIDWPCED